MICIWLCYELRFHAVEHEIRLSSNTTLHIICRFGCISCNAYCTNNRSRNLISIYLASFTLANLTPPLVSSHFLTGQCYSKRASLISVGHACSFTLSPRNILPVDILRISFPTNLAIARNLKPLSFCRAAFQLSTSLRLNKS